MANVVIIAIISDRRELAVITQLENISSVIVRDVKVSTSINCHPVDRKTDGFCTTTICRSIIKVLIASRGCRRNDFLIPAVAICRNATLCASNFHNFARIIVFATLTGRPVHRAIVANCQRTTRFHPVSFPKPCATIVVSRVRGGDASWRALHHSAIAIRNVISVTAGVIPYRLWVKRNLRIQFVSNFS